MSVELVLRQQNGVISRGQATAAGMSGDRIDRRLASGRWLRVHPKVYLAADRDLTDEARLVAAALWAGEPSTIRGVAAAWWLGLWPDPPSTVELTVPLDRCLRSPPGIRVRRRTLAVCDRVGVRGLWLTAVPLTVLEARSTSVSAVASCWIARFSAVFGWTPCTGRTTATCPGVVRPPPAGCSPQRATARLRPPSAR